MPQETLTKNRLAQAQRHNKPTPAAPQLSSQAGHDVITYNLFFKNKNKNAIKIVTTVTRARHL
jgi:hypothetical protein